MLNNTGNVQTGGWTGFAGGGGVCWRVVGREPGPALRPGRADVKGFEKYVAGPGEFPLCTRGQQAKKNRHKVRLRHRESN